MLRNNAMLPAKQRIGLKPPPPLLLLLLTLVIASVSAANYEDVDEKGCGHEKLALLKRGAGCFSNCSTVCETPRSCKHKCKHGG